MRQTDKGRIIKSVSEAERREKNKKDGKNKFDVIIIGGGAAGMSAALWCDDLKLDALLLESEKKLGGQLFRVYNPIENHLGTTAKNGGELAEIFLRQLKKRKFEHLQNAFAGDVNLKTKTVTLKDGRKFSAKAIIIATGIRRQTLGVEGEEKFRGRGILESGKRDAAETKNKIVCIVGGGDAAFENALILSEYAEKVYLVHRRKTFRAREEFVSEVRKNNKVEILTETEIVKISGKKTIEEIELKNSPDGKTFTIKADALLLRIGSVPNTEFLKNKIPLDNRGYIEIDSNCKTAIKNIYAVGDVANPVALTVSTAVGNAAAAVKNIQAAVSGNND